MTNYLLAFLFINAIYVLPGLALGRLFTGKFSKNPFFILLLSLLLAPFYYLFLAQLDLLNGLSWIILALGALGLAEIFRRKFPKSLIDSDQVFPFKETKKSPFGDLFKWGGYFLLVSFFLLIMIGKLGLPQGFLPVGDDKPRMQKTTSVAISPKQPLFYNFPISDMTIYYFNHIPSGLLTKFTNNFVLVNESWFIHTVILIVLMLWLIHLLATKIFSTYLERFVLIFAFTFSSGLEYFLAQWKGIKDTHLEWWTDWVGLNPAIHTQISAPITLFYWVSQHLFGGLLVIPLYFLIISSERKKLLTKILIALILAAMVGYTFFVFMTVAVIYVAYFLVRFLQRKEKLKSLIRDNFIIGGIGVLLALPMFLLYIGGEKGHYFIFHSNVFWFLPNNIWYYRPLNMALTAILFFLIEFGPLFITFVLGAWVFYKKKLYQTELLYWGLFLYVPVWVIFFVKALDDNNISMRSLIPTQVALAVISALVIGYFWENNKKRRGAKVFLASTMVLFIVLGAPTTIYEGWNRYKSAFIKVDPIYAQIDRQLPLNSIIFSTSNEKNDLISVLGHRFTFKDFNQFTVTDFEYVNVKKIGTYVFGRAIASENWQKILDGNPQLKTDYHLYYLGDVIDKHDFSKDLLHSDKLYLRETQ